MTFAVDLSDLIMLVRLQLRLVMVLVVESESGGAGGGEASNDKEHQKLLANRILRILERTLIAEEGHAPNPSVFTSCVDSLYSIVDRNIPLLPNHQHHTLFLFLCYIHRSCGTDINRFHPSRTTRSRRYRNLCVF